MPHHDMQSLCKETMKFASDIITSGMNLIELRNLCEKYMLQNGADSFWYWDVGAFIFNGKSTTRSVSGNEYSTEDSAILEDDIITIDLSPQKNNIWGDYARTLIVENGKVIFDIDQIHNEEWKQGILTEYVLHQMMFDFVTVDTTFEELFFFINEKIIELGYVNLDFLGNLGHSIVKDKNQRIYIEKGNTAKLSSVESFTFEPHISLQNGKYGYKHENIYYFNNNKLFEL